jgi:hypothetical protein
MHQPGTPQQQHLRAWPAEPVAGFFGQVSDRHRMAKGER